LIRDKIISYYVDHLTSRFYGIESIITRFFGHSFSPANNRPLISKPTHKMYIPRCERVCWKYNID